MINIRLLNLLNKDKNKLFWLTFLKLINLLIHLLSVLVICFVLKKVIIDMDYNALLYLLYVVPLILIKFFINYLNGKIEAKIGNLIQRDLRIKYFDKIINHYGIINDYNSSSLSNLGLEGIEQLNLYYVSYIPQFFYSLIAPIILFVVFSLINIQVALVFLISVPLIPLSIILISKYAKKIFNKYWNQYLSMGGEFLDHLRGIKELKLFQSDQIAQDKLDLKSEEFRKITMKVLIMQLWSTSIMDLVAFLGAAIGLSVGILNLINGNIDAFIFIFIVVIGAEFFLPMRALGSAFHISMNGQIAGNKILDILKIDDLINGNINISKIEEIKIENLDLKYGDFTSLKDFNLSLKDYGIYAIIGNSGSGKSTLIKALNKTLKIAKGSILINQNRIQDIDNVSYYQRACFISYESHLFNRSILENFRLINPHATKEEMFESLKKMKLDNFKDLNFKFNEDASNVSGGEKQRFILSFYLTLDYDLYVFDEATSNIDSESEEIIMSYIHQLAKKAKVILVTHRLKNVKNSRQICLLENGITIEKGSYKKLMSNQSKFKDLFVLQEKMEGLFNENDI